MYGVYTPYESYRDLPYGGRLFTQEERAYIFLASTMLTPVGWALTGPSTGAFALWKIRQALLLGSVVHSDLSSEEVVGPLESQAPPPPLEYKGRSSLHSELMI